MLTDVQIINNGLSKIASSRVRRIDPPSTPLEAYMSVNYAQWRRQELTKRRWVFAFVKGYRLTQVSDSEAGDKKYKYAMPIDCLRPIRTKSTEWVQAGRYIYSAYSTLFIDYIRNAPEEDDDPLFDEVLACKIAFESAEYVTQSSTKEAAALEKYKMAIRDAGSVNAFIIGPEDYDEDDDELTWLEAHHYG